MAAKNVFAHARNITGGLLPSWTQGEATQGNTLFHYEQQVDSQFLPDATPTFGIMNHQVQNERSMRKGTLSYDNLDVDDIFTSAVTANPQELGGACHRSESVIVDAVDELPKPPANSLFQISGKVSQIDRAHGLQTTETVDYWQELDEIVHRSPDAGGKKKTIRKKVVTPDEVLVDSAIQISAELQPIDDAKSLRIIEEATDGFGVLQTEVDHDPDGLGVTTKQVEQVKNEGFIMPAPSVLTVAQSLIDLGNGKHRYKNKTVAAWPTYIDQEEEEETGQEVLITRSVVDRNALPSIPKGVARSVKTLKNIDEDKALLVNRVIDSSILSTTYVEHHNVKYYFPAYLDATNPFSIITVKDVTYISVNKSSDHEFSLPCRFETTYHSSIPTVSEIFQFKPVDVSFSTPSVHENNVLVDEGVVQFFSPIDITTTTISVGIIKSEPSSYVEVSYGISASSPTTTEYLALMGSEVLIADEITRWKYNLWQRTKVHMKLPDLSLGLSGYLSY